jgi:hypothetical protein
MVGPDDERTPPQVGTPVTNSLDKTDELTLICHDFEMTTANGLLKNAMGPSPWCSTTPKPDPDASQSTKKSLLKSGRWRTEAVDRAFSCR